MRTLKALSQTAALLVLGATAQVASATCYQVYAPDSSIVFQSLQSPVDLSKPLHMTMPTVAPGGRLVFEPDNHACQFETNKLDTLHKVSPTTVKQRKRSKQQRRKVRRAKTT